MGARTFSRLVGWVAPDPGLPESMETFMAFDPARSSRLRHGRHLSVVHGPCGPLGRLLLLSCLIGAVVARGATAMEDDALSPLPTPPRLRLVEGEVSFWRTGAP